MKKSALVMGVLLVVAMGTSAQSTPQSQASAPNLAAYCGISPARLKSMTPTAGKPTGSVVRAKAKRPANVKNGKTEGLQRISRKPKADVCEQYWDDQEAVKPVSMSQPSAATAPVPQMPKPVSVQQAQATPANALPEGDLTKVLEPTAAGPAPQALANAAPRAFAAPAFSPATFTAPPSFGQGTGQAIVTPASRN